MQSVTLAGLYCLRDDMREIDRDRHRPNGTDVGATGVARRHPEDGLRGGACDAQHLSQQFACAAMSQRPEQHLDMHPHVLDRGCLAQHMSPLKVMERSIVEAGSFGELACCQLTIDVRTDAAGK